MNVWKVRRVGLEENAAGSGRVVLRRRRVAQQGGRSGSRKDRGLAGQAERRKDAADNLLVQEKRDHAKPATAREAVELQLFNSMTVNAS